MLEELPVAPLGLQKLLGPVQTRLPPPAGQTGQTRPWRVRPGSAEGTVGDSGTVTASSIANDGRRETARHGKVSIHGGGARQPLGDVVT